MTNPANETPASHSPPAVLTAAQRHDLARQFERAKQLAGKHPPDFAGVHRVLSEVCTLDPGNTLFVAALLENLHRADGKTATAWFWQVSSLRQQVEQAMRAKHWGTALNAGWRLLGERPNDPQVLLQLAEICGELEHLPTQIQLLQAAKERSKPDASLLAALARALAATGQFAESAAVWRQWMQHFGGPEPFMYLEAMDEPFDEADVRTKNVPRDESLPLRSQVAQLIEEQRWDAAEQLLAAESGAVGAELELRTLGEAIAVGRAQQRASIADRLLANSPTPAHHCLKEELIEELRRIELGVAFSRYERFSADPDAALELSSCLTRVGNYSEALKYLLPLRELPAWRLQALIMTGENLQALRQFERAFGAYREALSAEVLDPLDPHTQRGWYRGAVLAEAMGQMTTAQDWLERLTTVNPAYKDAAARLVNLRSICHKGGFPAEPHRDSSRGA